MSDSPLFATDGPLEVKVRADGTELPEVVEILSVEVTNKVGQIPDCTITLSDGNPATREFDLTDDTTLLPGTAIDVRVGYGSEDTDTIFSGLIVGMRLRSTPGGATMLELSCRSDAAKLHQARRSAHYTKKLASDIMTEIVSNASLTPDIDVTTGNSEQILRNDCTDWEYLRLLADRNGLLLYCDGKKVFAKAPSVTSASPLHVELGTDVLDFDLELSAQRAFDAASVRHWDPSKQAVTETESKAFDGPDWGNLALKTLARVLVPGKDKAPQLATPVALISDTAQGAADAIVQGTELGRIVGTVRFVGSAKAVPNSTIKISGLSDRMSGTALLTGVEHRIRDGNWTTTAFLGAIQQSNGFGGRRAPVLAAGLTTPIVGLQVGVVQSLDGTADPTNNLRLKITLPMLSDEPDGIWARFAAPYGGKDTGINFLPEVGDEVVVGFMGADPSHPVILGAVHSSNRAGPVEPDENNDLKIIKTRSGLIMTFDDEKTSVTIDTPAGAQLTLDDDATNVVVTDQNENKVTLDAAGITLESPKDITLKGDNITLEAQSNIDVKATGDATVSGRNVTAEAQAAATVKGSASAEISASGNTTVKGAMVMIN